MKAMADNEWVAAATADNEFAATLWRDILVDSGIPAYIESSGSATFLQVASALMPRRVMVPQEKLEEVDTPPVESDEADDA
jgi:rhamnogalacturonyl hydrolase YesR